TRDDIVNRRPFPDGCVPTTWDIDLHYPKEQYMKKYPDNPFISKGVFDRAVDRQHGYPVPYRCFYSRNIENLFMAGRCVSVTHEALGTVRVQRTGGMIGEVVGKAAALCVRHACLPRDVYTSHLEDLKRLLRLPGAKRMDVAHGQEKLPE
ncbi:MAG: FAD-dependent oxidoreductase, partial [Planctomycetota bacterium]